MRVAVLSVTALLVGTAGALISPALQQQLAAAGPNDRLPVCIVLREQFDPASIAGQVHGLGRTARRLAVGRALEAFAQSSQVDLAGFLQAAGAQDVRQLWVVNAVYCEATVELVRTVAARPDVAYVESDRQYAPGCMGEPAPATDEIAWGVVKIGAPQVWSLGHTGRNIVAAVISTGVNYNHPDLHDHMWTDPGYPYPGWDFENGDEDPMDDLGHGTFCAGVVASDGTEGSQCGVAPDAQIMALRVRVTNDSVSEMQCWQAIEFAIMPQGAPDNGADLYVMPLGWTLSWGAHQSAWRQVTLNANASGLCQVTIIGADQSPAPPYQARCPGTVPPPWWNPDNTGAGALAGMIAVGATDSSDVIASFSSHGPVTWMNVTPYNDFVYPPGLTKPEVVAPGVNIKSLSRTGGYVQMSGVSWACAHAAGAIALLLSRDSMMSPVAVDSVLELSAVPLGAPRKDNVYGAGRINVYAAVGLAEAENRESGIQKRSPTVVRGILRVPVSSRFVHYSLFDQTGRAVASLNSGSNDLSRLAPGVYFLRCAGESGSAAGHEVLVLR